MAQLSNDDFYAKWVPLLADNVFQDIDGTRLAQLLADLRDSFASSRLSQAPDVLPYSDTTVYAVGKLVVAGGHYYFSLEAGLLPAPTGATNAHWLRVPEPVAATALVQVISLAEAPGLTANVLAGEGDAPQARLVAGRLYGIQGPWNGAATEEVVYLRGLVGVLAQRGTVVHADGSQQQVDADVQAGEYTVATGGGPAAPVVSSGTELHFDQPARFYAPLASGTFTTSLAGLLACAFTRIVLGPSCTAPTLGPAFHVSGAFVAGAPNEYLFLVEPDGATVQVVITQLP